MKLMNSNYLVINKTPNYGSWGKSMEIRKRIGLHYNNGSTDSGYSVGLDRYQDRILSNSDLWTVYRRTPDVRACVDSIVRRVATFDWMVVPTVSPQNENYEELATVCSEVTRFLQKPNRNGDTWQEIMTAMLTDCLVFDAGVLELAYDRKGTLQELVPLRGSTISPVMDSFGRLKNYVQNMFEEGDSFSVPSVGQDIHPEFKRKQILYLSLFKNTADNEGNPIIECLVNQVISLLRGAEHAMLALDADEVPPGILVLAGIAGKAAEQAKADMQMLKGQDHKVRVMTTPDPQGMGAKWLELRRTPKDLSMAEIIHDIRKVVYRVFGIMPVEMGMTDGMPKATASVQMDVSTSHLVTPILELLQGKINAQIIPALIKNPELVKYIQFKFDRESRLSPVEQRELSGTYATYIKQGVLTRNEVREYLGLQPLVGGDVPTIEVAGMPQPLMSVVSNFDNENLAQNALNNPDLNKEELDEIDIKPVVDFAPEMNDGFSQIDSEQADLD